MTAVSSKARGLPHELPLARLPRRVGTSVAAAVIASGGLAVVEVVWALRSSTQPLNLARAWVSAFALVAPVAAVVGLAVGWVRPWIQSPLSRVLAAETRPSPEQRAPRPPAWRSAPALGLSLSLALLVVAHLAVEALGNGASASTLALALALGASAAGWLFVSAGLAVGEVWGASRPAARLGRGAHLALGALLLIGPIAWGVATGTPNGEGGPFGIFGVLSRRELDLRASGFLLALVGVAFAAPLWGRVGRGVVVVALLLASGALVATGSRLLDDLPLSLALERGGALSRTGLALARRFSDSDGDGASRLFGGGDCDDSRADVHPGALDLPENGVDEDCSGADAAGAAPPPPPPPTPKAAGGWVAERLPDDLNLLLISVDTLRHDLGYAGYFRNVSPNVDRLARRSVVFERAYALASYTGKSLGPSLIGLYPSETQRGFRHFNKFPSDTFVQERLQRAGIRTLSVQAHWYFTPEYGLGRGFDVLDLSAKPAKLEIEGDRSVTSDALTDAAIGLLSKPENVQGRFFAWVHYLDPHADYVPHADFDFGRHARERYDGEVAFTDHHVGRLLDFVQESEFADRTAIIFTSDHGEAFGEHNFWRHGFELWEPLVRIPMVVYVPGAEPRRHSVRRSAIDLVPTILDLYGLPQPEGEERLSGHSWLRDLYMPEGHVVEPRPVFIDMSAGPYNEERQALIQDGLKVIAGRGRFMNLYDLDEDPGEQRDLVSDSKLHALMKKRFEAFESGLRTVYVKPR